MGSTCFFYFSTAVKYLLHFRRGEFFRLNGTPDLVSPSFCSIGDSSIDQQNLLNDDLTQCSIEWRETDDLNALSVDRGNGLSRSSLEGASNSRSLEQISETHSFERTSSPRSFEQTSGSYPSQQISWNHPFESFSERRENRTSSGSKTTNTNPLRLTRKDSLKQPRPAQPNPVSSSSSQPSSKVDGAYDTGLGPFLTSLKLSKKKCIGSSDYQSLVCCLNLRYVCTFFRVLIPCIEHQQIFGIRRLGIWQYPFLLTMRIQAFSPR